VLALPASAGAAADGHERAPALPQAVTGSAIVLHYTTEGAGAIPDALAQELHAGAEQALAAIRADFAMAPHVSDQDGRIDVYVYDLALNPSTAAAITNSDDPAAPRASSYVRMKASFAMRDGDTVLAHELMHVLQFSVFQPTEVPDPAALFMLYEATAQLAAARHAPQSLPFAPPGVALEEPSTGRDQWPFFESIAEDHGGGAIGAIFEQLVALGGAERVARPLEAIDAALVARGSSLGDAITTHAVRMATGFTLPSLGAGASPPTIVPVTSGRRVPRPLRGVVTTLPRRSYQLIGFSPRKRRNCDTRRLEIDVRVPDGAAAPVLVPKSGPAIAFPLRDGRAVLKRKWKPCTSRATLVLSNPSGTDGLVHEVRSRLLARRSRR
jgi:hypothetical protein